MTFEEHLANHHRPDGSFDLAGAEQDRAQELNGSRIDERLAAKVAREERTQWEKRNGANLRKMFGQGFVAQTLGGELDLEVFVPLGDNVTVPLGAMNEERIRIREDLATEAHIRHIDAFAREIEFWRSARRLLPPGGSISDI